MKLASVLHGLRDVAPEHLAEPWDKPGLHVGDTAWPVRRGLLTIDLTPSVLAEARRRRCQLVVAYHPPIFVPLAALTNADWRQGMILDCCRQRIAVYSPHTALDAVTGGLNDWLAGGLGRGRVRVIRPPASPAPQDQFKLVVFVPPLYAERLRKALSRAGAGGLGRYTECSFAAPGEGTFRPGAGARPAIGRRGRLERVPELRLEMLCPADRLAEAIAALRQAHPYEEPAFDIFRPEPAPPTSQPPPVGAGRILDLAIPVGQRELVARVKKRLGAMRLQVVQPPRSQKIARIAVCVGAGGSLLDEAVRLGAQAFVTGEMRHHDVLSARERGLCLILAGHTQTERPYLFVYRRRLQQRLPGVRWLVSQADVPPTRLL